MNAMCGGCDTTWAGLSIAHCGACHETFSTVRWFDAHRSQGHCLDPAGLKRGRRGGGTGEPLLRRDSRGFWISAQARPDLEGVA